MKNKLKILFFIISIFVILSVTGILFLVSQKKQIISPIKPIDNGLVQLSKEEIRQQKISQFRQRFKFKSIIRKGDYFSVKNMKEEALRYYLNAYSRLPDDNTLELKIGDILFDLKRFEEAYSFYKKIPFEMLTKEERDQVAKTMYFANVATKEQDISHLNLDPEEQKYYLDILSPCYTGVHNCILSIEAYTGTYAIGKRLVDAVTNYEKISTDFQYRNALVAGIFLSNKDYRAATLIGDEILSKRPGYMSALKLTGFAHFELGEYSQTNTILQKYYESDPEDIKTSYILGIVNYELKDYVTSNLYFNTAVLNGYQPKTELERRMIYNYFVLDDYKSMFKVFRYLLDEPDVNVDDYIIAIYTAIDKHELSKASLWCEKGLALFPNDENLYALQGWAYQIKGEELNSKESLQKSLSLNPRNVMSLFYIGTWHFINREYPEAISSFQDVSLMDKGGDFGNQALEYLDKAKREQILSQTGVLSNTGQTVQ